MHGTIVQQSAQAAHLLCGPLCSLWLISPTLPNSDTPRSGSNLSAPKAARQDAAPSANHRFPHRILTDGHGVRHPLRKGWRGYGPVFDRIYRINRINRIEGRGNHAESAEGKGKLRLVVAKHNHIFLALGRLGGVNYSQWLSARRWPRTFCFRIFCKNV